MKTNKELKAFHIDEKSCFHHKVTLKCTFVVIFHT